MTLTRSATGDGIFGTSLVILTRDTGAVGDIEQHIGYTAPFGGILVQRYAGRSYVEQPYQWWRNEGFDITEPPVLETARELSRIRLSSERSERE